MRFDVALRQGAKAGCRGLRGVFFEDWWPRIMQHTKSLELLEALMCRLVVARQMSGKGLVGKVGSPVSVLGEALAVALLLSRVYFY